MIEIARRTFIPENELVFKTSRSGGPGGQNVNKTNTRVTLFFDAAHCRWLSDEQKLRIGSRLSNRSDADGVIRVVSQKFRTQQANRRAAVERLQQLLSGALKSQPIRRESTVPYGAKQRRLDLKRRRSLLKKRRMGKDSANDFGQ